MHEILQTMRGACVGLRWLRLQCRVCPRMPVIAEHVHPRSLNFANQRKVVALRDDKGEAWETICKQVVNLENENPSWKTCSNVYKAFVRKAGRRKYKYYNCGRQAWKITQDVEKHLLRRLRQLRKTTVCTSTVLQKVLAQERKVVVEASVIRKTLARNGYHWLPRAQKRQYNTEAKAARLKFAKRVVAMSAAMLRRELSFAMDGVVLSMPPADPADRENYCRAAVGYMWRKRSEGNSPGLAGEDDYANQVPLARAIPLWGGVSPGGFAEVLVHKTKKLNQTEWAAAVDGGKLTGAIKSLKPVEPHGPWKVICDNEGFLRTALSGAAHRRAGVKLWRIPAKSPDLNPGKWPNAVHNFPAAFFPLPP